MNDYRRLFSPLVFRLVFSICVAAQFTGCQTSPVNVGKPAYSWTLTNTTQRTLVEGSEMDYVDGDGQPVLVIWSGLAPAGSQTFRGGRYPIPAKVTLKWKFTDDNKEHSQDIHLPPAVAGSDKFSGTLEFKFYERDAFIEAKPVSVHVPVF